MRFKTRAWSAGLNSASAIGSPANGIAPSVLRVDASMDDPFCGSSEEHSTLNAARAHPKRVSAALRHSKTSEPSRKFEERSSSRQRFGECGGVAQRRHRFGWAWILNKTFNRRQKLLFLLHESPNLYSHRGRRLSLRAERRSVAEPKDQSRRPRRGPFARERKDSAPAGEWRFRAGWHHRINRRSAQEPSEYALAAGGGTLR